MQPRSYLQRVTAVLTVILMFAVLNPIQSVWASSIGPNNAGTGEDVPGIGVATWVQPENITTSGIPSTAILHELQTSHYLRGTAYGFTVPSGSTIQGITVVIRRQSGNPDLPNIRDYEVKLVKGGVITGSNKAKTGTDWPYTNSETATYGGTDDLWGTTWTVDDINASDFGVVLAVTNPNTTILKTARVDTMQIWVSYTLPGTTTGVYCGSNFPWVAYTTSIECTATVTRVAGSNTPSGTVSWTTSDSGTFTTSPCTLSGSNGSASCSIHYAPGSVGDGWHKLTATYAGDTNFLGSSGTEDVEVKKGTPFLFVTNSPVIYNGAPQTAQVIGSVPGVVSYVRYDGYLFVPTNADTYAISADFVPTDSANYRSVTVAPAGDFTIEKATPILAVTNSPVLYDGTPKAAQVTASAPGVVSNIRYDSVASVPTEIGTYAITVDFAPTNSTNYHSLTATSAGDFIIQYEFEIFLPYVNKGEVNP